MIATLANNFSKNYNVSILVKDEPKSFYELPDGVNIITLNYKLTLDMNNRLSRIFVLFKHLFGIGKILRTKINEIKPDYIYITTPYACLETILAGIPKEKIIISEHGSRTNPNFIYRFLKTLLYKKYPVQIVQTAIDYKWFKERGFPSVLIPHSRSLLPYEKCNLNSKTVLNIGRLTDDKNQLSLLHIWKIITEKYKSN